MNPSWLDILEAALLGTLAWAVLIAALLARDDRRRR